MDSLVELCQKEIVAKPQLLPDEVTADLVDKAFKAGAKSILNTLIVSNSSGACIAFNCTHDELPEFILDEITNRPKHYVFSIRPVGETRVEQIMFVRRVVLKSGQYRVYTLREILKN